MSFSRDGGTRLPESSSSSTVSSQRPSADPIKKPSLSSKEELQRFVYTEKERLSELQKVEGFVDKKLPDLHQMRLDPKKLRGNIEYLVGAVEIPVGVVGPLQIKTDEYEGDIFTCVATTEGALASSVQKGAQVLNLSGGVRATVTKACMTRAPLFHCESLENALGLKQWIESHKDIMKKQVGLYSQHARLIDIQCRIIAPSLHVLFVYHTGDASGQNMTTFCTWKLCQWLTHQVKDKGWFKDFIIEGNLSTDKKHSYMSAIVGRGREVIAEGLISHEVLERSFGVTASEMQQSYLRSQAAGVITGVQGFNLNVANLIAAVFTATGQDIACVHESSSAQYYVEEREEGLYVSLLLPNLIVGTVGGGTSLPIQKQFLEIMGCAGTDKADRLASAICAFALALEIATSAAIVRGHFVNSHEKLGRNRPDSRRQSGLLVKELDLGFFKSHIDDRIQSISKIDSSFGESLTTLLSYRKFQGVVGMASYKATFEDGTMKKLFVKSRLSDQEQIGLFEKGTSLISEELGQLLKDNRDSHIYRYCHKREMTLSETNISDLRKIMPQFYGSISDDKRSTYMLVHEHLENMELFEAVEQREQWTEKYITSALDQLTSMQAHFLNHPSDLENMDYLVRPDVKVLEATSPLYLGFAQLSCAQGWLSEDDLKFHRQQFSTLMSAWPLFTKIPKTLAHNDFNPRNICFKKLEDGSLDLVAYDWELATAHIPQRDFAELLTFILSNDSQKEKFLYWFELHRQSLEKKIQTNINKEEWLRGYEIALLELILCRFPIYALPNTHKELSFLENSYQTARKMLASLSI